MSYKHFKFVLDREHIAMSYCVAGFYNFKIIYNVYKYRIVMWLCNIFISLKKKFDCNKLKFSVINYWTETYSRLSLINKELQYVHYTEILLK